ncbi:E motif [Dillenia turbinata]|uniref:E motif n=1 Tax=Dillenia turbinata TaxID=194707 RepID=A0AAN8VWQ1_9MAGN
MFNTMIRGYVESNKPVHAICCYLDMLSDGVLVNNFTFTPLIKACTCLKLGSREKFGVSSHSHVVKFGFCDDPFVVSALIEFYTLGHEMGSARKLFDRSTKRDVVVWTAMVDGYGKMGDVENARKLFDLMPERNVISWSAMMAAYSRVSNFKEVLALFGEMQEVGVKPNESAFVSVLTACANVGALTQGLWVHSFIKRNNLESNMILATALVDMYSKCGCVHSALLAFEGILDKDVKAWNAVISGVAMNGHARKSLELFYKMVGDGIQPNEITFVSILSACTHSKFVEEGLKLFEKMSTCYDVEPQLEHYACVVDLLARAGKLEEAEKLIDEKMGGIEEGDANVWGALLGACRTYGNVEVGNRVWRRLVDMRVADCGALVLSYNMYKEAGWEEEANRVRKMISNTGMKKKPGCSVIEVDGVVEEFIAGNVLHCRVDEICNMLDSLFNVVNLEDF